jgi:hypothetical protein
MSVVKYKFFLCLTNKINEWLIAIFHEVYVLLVFKAYFLQYQSQFLIQDLSRPAPE